MVGLANWIGSDALGVEEQMGILVGTNYSEETWIGFCQKRRFWLQKKENTNIQINENIEDKFLYKITDEWKDYNSEICNPIKPFVLSFGKYFIVSCEYINAIPLEF